MDTKKAIEDIFCGYYDSFKKNYRFFEKDTVPTIELECPGLSKTDITVKVAKNILYVHGENKESKRTVEQNFDIRGYVVKSVSLVNGILYVKLNKTTDEKILTIE